MFKMKLCKTLNMVQCSPLHQWCLGLKALGSYQGHWVFHSQKHRFQLICHQISNWLSEYGCHLMSPEYPPNQDKTKRLVSLLFKQSEFWISSSLTLAVRLSVALKLPTKVQFNHAMVLEYEDQSLPQKLVMSFWNEIRSSDTNPTAVISPKRPWTAASIPPPTLWPSACFLWWSFPCALCGLCSSGWRSRSLRKCCLPWR